MLISVIIPVYGAGHTLPSCLAALSATAYEAWECIIVDDGASREALRAAAESRTQIIRHDSLPGGPALARNLGAQAARGDVLLFLDADVLVQPETIGRVAAIMQERTDVAACFGSYDDAPTEQNFLSQYRNLQHHFVHQTSRSVAFTFWSGCGAVRRELFLQMGGFNPAYDRPSIEDIELGYRLRANGHAIHLDKRMQVRHMKAWTVRQLLWTDVFQRAIPWTQLILKQGRLPNDLNLQKAQRFSAAFAFLGITALITAFFVPWAGIVAPFPFLLLLVWNRAFYAFLKQKRGSMFLIVALIWHWFYFIYSGLSFVGCLLWYRLLHFENPSPGMVTLPPLPSWVDSSPASNQV